MQNKGLNKDNYLNEPCPIYHNPRGLVDVDVSMRILTADQKIKRDLEELSHTVQVRPSSYRKSPARLRLYKARFSVDTRVASLPLLIIPPLYLIISKHDDSVCQLHT